MDAFILKKLWYVSLCDRCQSYKLENVELRKLENVEVDVWIS